MKNNYQNIPTKVTSNHNNVIPHQINVIPCLTRNLSSFPRVRAGFTLIELLVVVLIIGVLASVALPQYRRAVARSRYQQLVIMGTKIADAEKLHHMATGAFTIDFSELDLDFVGTVTSTTSYQIFRWDDKGSCSLRVYNGGNTYDVQCQYGDKYVPEFDIYNSFTKRYCTVTPNKDASAHSLCKAETQATTPAWQTENTAYRYQ